MQISANGISLEVEDHGPTSGEPLVLIMGLGMQLVAWHEDFVAQLVAHGFRVIRFDNRDIGLSQRFDHLGVPNLAFDAVRHRFGLPVSSPYTIADMAHDTAALLDALGLPAAHVCGASMGGMIAQQLAVRHPQRVKSLTLMMTTSGARSLPQPRWKVQLAMLSRPKNPRDVESVIDHYVRIYKLIGSPGFPATDAYLHERLGLAVRRSHRPAAVARQLVAIAADGDRSALLHRVQAPTQIIHGLQDPLVPVECGRDLARRIGGARLDLIEGMGHDLPVPLWPRFVAGIRDAAARA
jgi:pimeloyl-ACP methyl ester carboxylesterase